MAQTSTQWVVYMDPPSKGHLGVCAIYSETTVIASSCLMCMSTTRNAVIHCSLQLESPLNLFEFMSREMDGCTVCFSLALRDDDILQFPMNHCPYLQPPKAKINAFAKGYITTMPFANRHAIGNFCSNKHATTKTRTHFWGLCCNIRIFS